MKDIISSAKVIVIVEKDATFQRLLEEDFLKFVNFEILLITGKGVPDISTRKLVHRLAHYELKDAEFVALVDGDPYGKIV